MEIRDKCPSKVPLDACHAKINELRPPTGARNAVVISLDDVGLGRAEYLYSGINVPTMDSLATEGLR